MSEDEAEHDPGGRAPGGSLTDVRFSAERMQAEAERRARNDRSEAERLRYQCLDAAVRGGCGPGNVVRYAAEFYAFVKDGTTPKE